ncbi:hypothetical protein J7337_006249 [Fusarium musae]|uniref:Uncharacterized protein n=1 Tax=Fusarium musae TaxID=1042133 RepID=A0A9P8IRS3_9HYPO|nr:hypothetical protein J7337_006249 [Fusarium musae]KAG9503404.1 hypothetical protein J7337_006249 [Fusarium musae]
MSTAIFMEGYGTMLIGNMFGLPEFRKRYGRPAKDDTYQIPAPWKAGLTNGSACVQLQQIAFKPNPGKGGIDGIK